MTDRPAAQPFELLAPAGEERALRAALAAGADAVYVGMQRFSARAFAGNFDARGLLAAIDRVHLHSARAYLALNIALKQGELDDALRALEAPYAAGLDALIVADLGFADRVRAAFPDLPLHASTQLNSHSSAQLARLAELGFSRTVLARELSLQEIRALDTHGLELEVFAHGALCYGYSGACLFASMVGGRSGNRGRCAQACRMRYRLRAATQSQPDAVPWREEVGRVLSASDLAALEALPALLAAGVQAFKIEGRMKDATYVATATAVYREALLAAAGDAASYRVLPQWRERLEQSFSRGFTGAHLQGRHEEVRSRDRGGHRGVPVGRVDEVDELTGRITVRLTAPVSVGDVVTIFTRDGQTEPQRVQPAALSGEARGLRANYKGDQPAGRLELTVREAVMPRDRVFRLSAAALDEMAEDAITGRSVARPVALHARLEAAVGRPAMLRLAADGEEVEVRGEPLEAAEHARLNAGRARNAVGALGGTPYRLASFTARLEGGPFVPVGSLKEMRRRGLSEIDRRRLARHRRASKQAPAEVRPPRRAAPRHRTPLPLVMRLRIDEQPLIVAPVAALALDLRASDTPDLVEVTLGRLRATGLAVRCRPPEILFDAQWEWWSHVSSLPWDAVYVRHLGLLGPNRFAVPPDKAILEYPLQGFNAETARLLRTDAVLASPEASLNEIAALAAELAGLEPPARVEALAFGREQLLVTRDVLGQAEGVVPPGGSMSLRLTDAQDYTFPVEAAPDGSRLMNSRVTNVAAAEAVLAQAGVTALTVVQRDLLAAEREAFMAGGLGALAAFADPARSTTGHLFRGVT